MGLFSIYGGVGQLGRNNKAVAATVAAWLYGDYGGSGGARIDAANCIAAYCPIGAADLTASYGNLANPGTYTAAAGSAPSFAAATGWTFGSGNYLTTGVVPLAQTWSYVIRFTNWTSVAGFQYLFGVSDTWGNIGILPRRTDVLTRFANGSTLDGASIYAAGGVLAMGGNKAYVNGAAVTGAISGWTGTTALDFYINGSHNAAGSTLRGAYVLQALWFYNVALTAQQIAGLTGAINALTSAGNYYL